MRYLLFVFLIGPLFSCNQEAAFIDLDSINPAAEDTADLEAHQTWLRSSLRPGGGRPNKAYGRMGNSTNRTYVTHMPRRGGQSINKSEIDYFDINKVWLQCFNCPIAVTKNQVDYYPYK